MEVVDGEEKPVVAGGEAKELSGGDKEPLVCRLPGPVTLLAGQGAIELVPETI